MKGNSPGAEVLKQYSRRAVAVLALQTGNRLAQGFMWTGEMVVKPKPLCMVEQLLFGNQRPSLPGQGGDTLSEGQVHPLNIGGLDHTPKSIRLQDIQQITELAPRHALNGILQFATLLAFDQLSQSELIVDIPMVRACSFGAKPVTEMGKKSRDKGRWSIGIKLCWLLDTQGRVVAWDWNTMNVSDKHFHHVVEPFVDQTIACTDWGFRSTDGVPENMKLCKKGTWNDRMFIETALSMVTIVCDLKRIRHRVAEYVTSRLACVSAMFYVLLQLSRELFPDSERRMSICKFSL